MPLSIFPFSNLHTFSSFSLHTSLLKLKDFQHQTVMHAVKSGNISVMVQDGGGDVVAADQ